MINVKSTFNGKSFDEKFTSIQVALNFFGINANIETISELELFLNNNSDVIEYKIEQI